MPFKTRNLVIGTFLLGAALGVTTGWALRGRWSLTSDATPTSESVTIPGKSGSHQLNADNRRGGNPMESPFATALQMLQTRSRIKTHSAFEFAIYQFQQVLMLCSESETQQLLEALLKNGSTEGSDLGLSDEILCQIVLNRLTVLNPTTCWKNLEACAEVGLRGVANNINFFQILLSTMTPDAVQQAISTLPTQLKQDVTNAWLLFRAEADPEGVLKQIATAQSLGMPVFAGDEDSLSELLQKVAESAPDKALESANLIESGDGRAELRSELFDGWMVRDPVEAGKYAVQQRDARLINNCLDYSETALSLDQLRDELPSLKSENPWELSHLSERITAELAKRDLSATKAWAASLPTFQQQWANVGVLTEWLRQDVTGASQWLTTWPESEARDRAVKNLIYQIGKDDALAALSWAQTLQSEARYKETFKIIEGMNQSSSEAAEAALRSLPTDAQSMFAAFKRAEVVKAQRKAAEKAGFDATQPGK